MTAAARSRLTLAVAALALLALALVVSIYFLVEARGSLESATASRAETCDAMKQRAFRDIEAAAALDRAGLAGRADERLPGVALADYTRTCVGEEPSRELADKLGTLVVNLHRAGRADDLETLVRALSSAPPNEWTKLQLPVDPAVAAQTTHLIGWETDENVAKVRAQAESKGLMVFATATWCVPCQSLERTLGMPGPYAAMAASFVPLRLDVTEDDPATTDAKRRYNLEGTLPRVQFFIVQEGSLVSSGTISEATPNYLEESGLQEVIAEAAARERVSQEGAQRGR